MNTHPNLKPRVVSQGAADLQRTLSGGFRGVAENQRHSISTRQAHEPTLSFGKRKMRVGSCACRVEMENQRHSISTRQAHEPTLIFRLPKLVCSADDCV